MTTMANNSKKSSNGPKSPTSPFPPLLSFVQAERKGVDVILDEDDVAEWEDQEVTAFVSLLYDAFERGNLAGSGGGGGSASSGSDSSSSSSTSSSSGSGGAAA